MVHQNEKRNNMMRGGWASAGAKDKDSDPSWYFFNTYGSSFNQLQVPFTAATKSKQAEKFTYPADLFRVCLLMIKFTWKLVLTDE